MLPKYTRLLVLLCLLPGWAKLYAQDKQLDALKKQDNLQEWLMTRMDRNAADPQHQLLLLMATQSAAWRQPKNQDERLAWLMLLSNQGYYQLQSGDILNSINYYEQGYSYFYRYKLDQFDITEYVLKPLSNNYTRLGDYERAIFIQQKVLDRLKPADDADDMAAMYSNMAITNYSMGDYGAAAVSIAKGIALVKDPTIRLRLNYTMADVLFEKDDFKAAESLIKTNITAQKKVDENSAYWLMGGYTTLGNINLKTNRLDVAAQYFNTALGLINTWYPGARQREKANILARLGKIERLKNHAAAALKYFDEALQILRINTAQNQTLAQNIYGENNLVEVFHEKALTYQRMGQPEQALTNMRYALLATDQIRKEFADNKTKERLQQDGKDLAEVTIEIALKLYAKTAGKTYLETVLAIAEQTKARTLADQIQQNKQRIAAGKNDTSLRKKLELERAIVYNQRMLMNDRDTAGYQKKIAALKFELALLNKTYRDQSAAYLAPVKEMLAALPANRHVIEYFFGSRGVYAIDIKNKTVAAVTMISRADSLKQQLNRLTGTYYQNGPDRMINAPKSFYELSNQIYTTLFAGNPPAPNEQLCIVPDDVLGYLSFDGLITKKNHEPAMSQWPFLIRSVTTTYAFSLNSLTKYTGNRDKRNTFSGLFITHENNSNTPIAAVAKEAAAIKEQVSGNFEYDDEVNTRSFFEAFEKSATLHISTHAYLSGTGSEPTLDFGREKLFLFELLAKSNKPNLVVLSACRTGDGLLAKGEGIISLSRGFSAIGTPATIAGLWNVNDDAVSQITAGMYQHLLTGESSGMALHNAKLAWLNSNQLSDALYLPYYWDSLILMGADEPVALKAARKSHWEYWVSALVIALGGVGFWLRRRK